MLEVALACNVQFCEMWQQWKGSEKLQSDQPPGGDQFQRGMSF